MYLALPSNDHCPAVSFKLFNCMPISRNVVAELALPEAGIRLWGRRQSAALVSMPIAAMNEDSHTWPYEDDVGTAR